MSTPRVDLTSLIAACGLAAISLSGCRKASEPPAEATPAERAPARRPETQAHSPAAMTISSPAFEPLGRIPPKYTADGQNISPPLVLANVPDGAAELALICDDPDAPGDRPWVHWVVYHIPARTTELAAGQPPPGSAEGENSWGTRGYRGPAPPPGHGTHHYHFKLYALWQPPDVAPTASGDRLAAAMEGKIMAEAELIGTYRR